MLGFRSFGILTLWHQSLLRVGKAEFGINGRRRVWSQTRFTLLRKNPLSKALAQPYKHGLRPSLDPTNGLALLALRS